MVISVRGAKDKEFTSAIKQASYFFTKTLLSKRLYQNIDVQIFVLDKLHAGGYCYTLDSSPHREFIIELKRTPYKIITLKTLAHEFVHLKQFATGAVKFGHYKNSNVTRWNGVYYNDEDLNYWDHPWELEAYGLENSLVAKYLAESQMYKFFKQRPSDWLA